MFQENLNPEDLVKDATKPKDGDQLYKADEDFQALMGDDEDTVAFVFQHVEPEHEGTLTCVAKTTRGILSFGAVVQDEVERALSGRISPAVNRGKPFRHWKPSLIVEKTEVVCYEGDQAMLQVQINGYPKPDMRCTFKDLPIIPSLKYKIYHESEEHILLLVIKNVQLEDAGIYTIMAENEIGFYSVDIKLTVIRQRYPEIKTKCEDISIAVGQNVIIPVEVDGIPKPDVRFLKEGHDIMQNQYKKIHENYPHFTLELNELTLRDSGVYSVIAANLLSQVSQFWSIYVYSQPKFLYKLGPNLEVSQDDTIILKARIESEPKATVKWWKNDQEISSVDNKRLIIDYEKEFYLLTIKNIIIQDAAIYKFTAENVHGTIEDSVRIDVKKAPTIIEAFEDAEVLEQDVYHIIHTVEFTIKLEAFPKPDVQWFLDGKEIENDITKFTRIETDEIITLIINEPTTDLSGEYQCLISNECGNAQTKARLTVNCSPRIIVHLLDQIVEENNFLYLEIIVRSFPLPKCKLFRNNQELEPNERVEMGLSTYGKKRYKLTFLISEISYAERGEYEMEVYNSFGSMRSRCTVDVLTKPVILEAHMPDMVIKEGADVTYTIRTFSNPLPEVTWTWEGELINREDKKDKNKLITSHDSMDFRLGIRKAQLNDAGIYQCSVENCVGITKYRAALVVMRKKSYESSDED